jgi:hypothetical protein
MRALGASAGDVDVFRASLTDRLSVPDDDTLRPGPEFIRAHRHGF